MTPSTLEEVVEIGGSLVLIALGAILRWAVTDDVSGVNVPTVGTILLVVGGLGLLISLFFWSTRRRTGVVETRRVDTEL